MIKELFLFEPFNLKVLFLLQDTINKHPKVFFLLITSVVAGLWKFFLLLIALCTLYRSWKELKPHYCSGFVSFTYFEQMSKIRENVF